MATTAQLRRNLMALTVLLGSAAGLAAACSEDETAQPQTTGQGCDTDAACLGGEVCCMAPGEQVGVCQAGCECEVDADCAARLAEDPSADFAACCQGRCELGREAVGDCRDSGDCATGLCEYASDTDCLGTCSMNGSGGSGAGGSGGSGGAAPLLPPYSVLSGNPTVDGEGCLSSYGPGAIPVHIVLDQPLTEPTTVTVSGRMMPVPQGAGIDGVALVQVSGGGVVNGNSIEGAYLGRGSHNTLDGTGTVGIFDPVFNEVATAPWTPSGDEHDFSLAARINQNIQSMFVDLIINGTPAASTTASGLGAAGGPVLSILFAQAQVCEILLTFP